MARTYTRAQIRTRAKQLADMTYKRKPTDDEWNDLIDVYNAEFHELLYQSGLAYKQAETTIATTGVAAYNLPAGFLGLLKLEYQIDSSPTRYTRLSPVHVLEDHMFSATGSEAVAYQLVNDTVVLYPTPPSGQTYRLRYVPMATKLTADSDTIDGINGWEQIIAVNCAIDALVQEESDPSALIMRKNELEVRIRQASQDRLIADGGRIADVRNDLGDNDPADLPRRRVSWW